MDAIYNLVSGGTGDMGGIYLFVLPVSEFGNTAAVAKMFIGNFPEYLLIAEESDGTLVLQTDW
jgi:hypothetical protein